MHWRILILLIGTAALPALAAERTLAVDEAHSRVEIDVKATVDSFVGTLTHFTAAVRVDDAGMITQARFGFHFADVLTGKAKRDEKMHQWQDTAHHPDGEFVLRALERAADGRWLAHGRLRFHDIERPLDVPIAVTSDGSLLAIDGEAIVDTRDFSLPVIRLLGLLKVDPRVAVRFHLQGNLAAR
ncbi:MAG: YceI family protein [Opitutaceae bacterium]|nr:YceI family protein [Opitutaceae bacterium]